MNTVRKKGQIMEGVWQNTIWISMMPTRVERRQKARSRVRENSCLTFHPENKTERINEWFKKKEKGLLKNKRIWISM